MTGKRTAVFALGLAGLLGAAFAAAPEGLAEEYRENPDGLDTPSPRLSWRLPDGTARQTAYELEIDGVSQGRVASSESLNWSGGPLATSQHVTWRVRTWDEAGRASDWSPPATFTMGVMRPGDWRAKWIGPAPETRPDYDFGAAQWITAPADAQGVVTLETAFPFDGARPGTCVEFVHAGVSQHEIRVNGRLFHQWAGHVHDWRYPRFRDLTPYLAKGTNTIVVRVFADRPRKGTDPVDPIRVHAPEGVRAFLARIDFPDGTARVTGADGWTSPQGPVTALGRARETSYGKPLLHLPPRRRRPRRRERAEASRGARLVRHALDARLELRDGSVARLPPLSRPARTRLCGRLEGDRGDGRLLAAG